MSMLFLFLVCLYYFSCICFDIDFWRLTNNYFVSFKHKIGTGDRQQTYIMITIETPIHIAPANTREISDIDLSGIYFI